MWLDAGNYTVVQVDDKEITTTIGGTSETVTDEGSQCEYNDYTVVTTTVDGAAINVANAGLYRVTHDSKTNELVMYPIESVGLIGSATPNGWGADTPIAGSVTADGGKWEATGLIMRNGEWKIRFNCRWSVNRRLDPNAPLADENGYQLFNNFGGEVSNLLPGNDGANIAQAEDGEYTVTIEWDPRNGWSVVQTKTGEAPTLNFDPNDYNMGIIGDATAGSWDTDRNMLYKFENDVHSWYGVVTLLGEGNMKFRANDAWDFNLGGALTADGVATTLAAGGADIPTPGAGQYYVTLSTADEGTTWVATMVDFGWAVIGEGSPSMNWDDDTAFTADGFADGVTSYSLTGDFTTASWKIRAGKDWKLNLGGDLGTLTLDGSDLAVSEAGTYTVTMTFDGADYSATAVKQ